MKNKTPILIFGLVMALSMQACGAALEQPAESVAEQTTVESAPSESVAEPTMAPSVPAEALTTPLPIATSEALIPDGWVTYTYTSQQCEYAISHPAEMQLTDNGTYSRIIGFELPDPDQGMRNFIYVSVVPVDLQPSPDEGVYNYDPMATEILLNMRVGESKSAHASPSVESGFTYQRQPDTLISGHTAQTYENVQPWEFPAGTKEIRYYLSLNGCTYLIGGYMDTTGSNQPGAITEEFFKQIAATIQLIP